MREIEAGFVTFTEVTETGDHRAYNEWHQLDHMPEQFRIPGIAFGRRWVFAPECASRQVRVADALPPFHYVTLYLMTGPLSDTLRDFTAVRERLTDLGRFYPHRRTALSGAWRFLEAWSAPRVLVSPEAVPYRPSLGVYVVVEQPGPGFDAHARWLHASHVPALLEVPGVAGVWAFGTRLWGFSPSGDEAENATRITVMFLDGDPLTVADEVAPLVRRRWEGDGVRPRLVDDGLATGVTAEASLRALARRKPRRLIMAVPVCSRSAAARVGEVAEVVCVECPARFAAVGEWYDDFRETSDEEVVDLLDQARVVWGTEATEPVSRISRTAETGSGSANSRSSP